jgi:carbon-monoxide dehydrogenase large subunit
MGAPLIGARVQRKEDYRFLTGAGQYTDDVTLPHQTYAVFVRSPHAHAKIKSIGIDKAKKAPGVLAVYTGADTAAAKLGGLPCGWLITDVNGQPMKEPPYPVLAQDKVRHVGERVAAVIAETQEQARDAAELVQVDYEVLPAVADGRLARAKGAAQLHDVAPDNTCYVWALGDKAAVDAAFAKAAHVTKLDFVNNRLIPNAIEPRAANGTYSRADDSYTLYVASQNPHVERLLMTAFVMGLPEHKVRVVAGDVGGGFGSKIYLYGEDVVVTWASKQLARPVKWTADRSESYVSDAHGRDHHTIAELALDKDGKFLAMRVKTTANIGAYLSTFASCVPTILYATAHPLRGDRRVHQYRAGRRVSRRRTPGGHVRGRAPGGNRGARHEDGSCGDPAQELHPQLPVPDAGRTALRHRRLRRDDGRRAEDGRRCGLRGAQEGLRGQGQAARHGLRRVHRGLRHRALGGRRIARRARGPVRGG